MLRLLLAVPNSLRLSMFQLVIFFNQHEECSVCVVVLCGDAPRNMVSSWWDRWRWAGVSFPHLILSSPQLLLRCSTSWIFHLQVNLMNIIIIIREAEHVRISQVDIIVTKVKFNCYEVFSLVYEWCFLFFRKMWIIKFAFRLKKNKKVRKSLVIEGFRARLMWWWWAGERWGAAACITLLSTASAIPSCWRLTNWRQVSVCIINMFRWLCLRFQYRSS